MAHVRHQDLSEEGGALMLEILNAADKENIPFSPWVEADVHGKTHWITLEKTHNRQTQGWLDALDKNMPQSDVQKMFQPTPLSAQKNREDILNRLQTPLSAHSRLHARNTLNKNPQ